MSLPEKSKQIFVQRPEKNEDVVTVTIKLACVKIYIWSHTQAQMGNGVQLGFSIDVTLRKDT